MSADRVPDLVARRAWQAFLALGLLAAAGYVWLPPLKGSGPLINLLGLYGVLAIVVGARVHRPASAAPWYLFALGLALFWLGDLYTYSYPLLLHREVPFPSFGDAVYVAVYPVLMAGLLLLVRRRSAGKGSGSSIDAAILTLGLSLPSWVWLMAPYLHDHELSLLGRVVSVAYPLGDVLLLAAAIRLAVDAGRRQPAFFLMSSSIVCLLATDFVYGLLTLDGSYHHQLWLDLGWIGFYLLWGAAALHPSMPELERPADAHETVLTRFRLVLLTGASLVAPAIGLVHDIQAGDLDMGVVRVASLSLFCLVVLRVAGLVRQQERSLERERLLSAAGTALVAATSREEIDEVAVDFGRRLAGPQTVVALSDTSAPAAQAARHRHRLAVEIAPRRASGAYLTVSGDGRVGKAVDASLRALATQVALALDSATLTEEVHRRRGEARFSSLVQHASDLITVVGPDGRITYQSPSIERVLGYAADDVIGSRFDQFMDPAERGRLLHILADGAAAPGGQTPTIECALRHLDGTLRQFEVLSTNLLDDPAVCGIVLNSRDVSERKAFEQQLTHQAFHDPVTGLANRALFAERVRHALTRGRREGRGMAVVFLDLDDFKTINDSLGHAAGDEVLVEVAKRLATSVRASDTAARFGGDEFALLLEDIDGVQEAADTAERVLEMLAVPLQVGHKELSLRGSLGISIAEGDTVGTAEEMIRDADAAMYIAKRDGKGGYRLFEPAMHEGVLARLELRTDLQRALTSGQLELYYQPVVRLDDGRVSGVEALLRWRHPERGVISPDQFIPLAEETGLIVPIGRWVLREGCRQARRILAAFPVEPAPTMSINLSLKQLQHSDIVADVRDALHDADLPPSSLTLEITETVLMADTDLAVERLREIKELGVRLALDDFGTGYSSLSYLSKFPVDILKMDRSFLYDGATPASSGLTTAVLALGATLNLEVVAEGIELAEQEHALRDLGCDLGQGFLFARPMEVDATMAFLAARFEEAQASAGPAGEDAP
jgi:diguanylate cyclase (GGDEF)-like protein/PAS domain S-box-containing protein